MIVDGDVLAVDLGLRVALAVFHQPDRLVPARSRCQQRKIHPIATVERQFLHLPGIDVCGDLRGLRINQRSFADDVHRLCHRRRHHLDPGDLIRRHLAQRVIERFGSEKERAVQHGAVDLALEDACLDQAKKRLEQHFADAVETFFEGSGLQSRGWLGCGRKPLHDRMKSRIVVVTDDQTLRQRIAHLPDADLQCAAVAHETRGMQPDGIFGVADRLGRRRKQREIGRGAVEHRAEFVGRQIAQAGHERQLGIDLADQLERCATLRAGAQDIQRRVGVAAQAVAGDAVDDAFRHQLGDDIETARQQIRRGMGIVGRNIVLLRIRHVQPLSGQKEKLDHAHVGRQSASMQRVGISKIRVTAEQAVDHGRDEAVLDQVLWPWLLQRQRGKQRQADRTIGDRARIERIDDVVGLAEPKRQADHQIGPDIADDVLCDGLGLGEKFRHQVQARANRKRRPDSDASQAITHLCLSVTNRQQRRIEFIGFLPSAVCLWPGRPLNR